MSNRYGRMLASTLSPRRAKHRRPARRRGRLVCRMQGLWLQRGRLGAAGASRREVRSASVLLAFADPATRLGLRGPNAANQRARGPYWNPYETGGRALRWIGLLDPLAARPSRGPALASRAA